MFDHFALGTQLNPAGPDPPQLSPLETPEPGTQSMQWSPPSPADLEDEAPSPPRRRTSVETLARRLSEQHLRRGSHAIVAPGLPPPTRHFSLPLQPSMADTGPAIEVDPRYLARPREPSESCSRRLRHQPSTKHLSSHATKRDIDALVESMMASGEQCNVHLPPPATPAFIEADDEADLLTALEVDEAIDADFDEAALLESMTSMRRAAIPRGIRKHKGLHYRSSADVALRCANVVRSQPRMRKRKHAALSIASSTASTSISQASPLLTPSTSPTN